jgi:2-iminoacetate synthase ThiH
VETVEDRIEHLERLRTQQEKSLARQKLVAADVSPRTSIDGKFAPTDVGGYFASGLQTCRQIIDALKGKVVFD